MNATTDSDIADTGSKKAREEKKEDNFLVFVLKLALIVVVFRSFFFSPFNIPSESMLPTLMNGDYLVASKWSYGYTKHSMPFSAPVIPGRIFASEPDRGDVVIFKHPIDTSDYIKRVIGLPGDTVAMRDGVVILNGTPLERERAPDLLVPLSDNTECHQMARLDTLDNGEPACRYMRYRETMPGEDGASYYTFDLANMPQDNFGPIEVPEGQMFLMGDNRDNSLDSRFAAAPRGGIGLVDQDLLVGKAQFLMWSTDGSANWFLPWTWFQALRGDRLGTGL
ncbi:signal peptidase I [Qipengyuania sp. JC766]|uniref:signal peptidase I n=1 Tax=Qipengyuania sp. JC766 TaxID=3232139 RepID=UPI00345A803C